MQKAVLEILVMLVFGMNSGPCAGFPVYDYDLPSLRQALSASVADVNSRSLSPYLFRAFRSTIKRVNMLDENSLSMDIEFSIRETTCRRGSGEDPATCDFQRGYYVPAAACRSTVRMSAGQVQDVWVRCRWSSSSESDSSEEMGFRYILGSSRWRNSDLFDLVPDRPASEQFYGRSFAATTTL
ncbi:secreted phosphoprotein 24 isoform X2 [Desmodus rotundus]|uniref:secreted phosphoprotein 24 isoform X2 n=1 Tax=Desmodus rotundus TaxID=9430 RepID=UPI0023815256|nr:secreted phosphoprotein 24 isoform X2 [Desmodus rotundus]